jgi:hypothetical protein
MLVVGSWKTMVQMILRCHVNNRNSMNLTSLVFQNR